MVAQHDEVWGCELSIISHCQWQTEIEVARNELTERYERRPAIQAFVLEKVDDLRKRIGSADYGPSFGRLPGRWVRWLVVCQMFDFS